MYAGYSGISWRSKAPPGSGTQRRVAFPERSVVAEQSCGEGCDTIWSWLINHGVRLACSWLNGGDRDVSAWVLPDAASPSRSATSWTRPKPVFATRTNCEVSLPELFDVSATVLSSTPGAGLPTSWVLVGFDRAARVLMSGEDRLAPAPMSRRDSSRSSPVGSYFP